MLYSEIGWNDSSCGGKLTLETIAQSGRQIYRLVLHKNFNSLLFEDFQ